MLVALLPLAFFPWTLDPFLLPKQVLLIIASCASGLSIVLSGIRFPASRVARWALAGLCLVEVLALAASVDRFSSVLGNFGYRMGFVSHLGLAVIWLAAFVLVRSERRTARLFSVSVLVSLLVCSYALLQFAGGDPLDWADKSTRAFSTLGNPNDLAGYLVLATCFAGAAPFGWKRVPRWFTPCFLAALCVSVLLTESRSGVLGMAAVGIVLPCLAFLGGWPRQALRQLAIALTVSVVVLLLFASVSGEASRLTGRFAHVLDSDQSSLSTREDIWRGSLAAYAAHPIFGLGQDGLLVTFNRERPADLGPPFSESANNGIDPLVGSPHSLPIEILVTLGPLGLAMVTILFGWHILVFWRALRSHRLPRYPYIGAGMFGYLVVASLNPISLSSLAVACLIAGCVVGQNAESIGSFQLPRRLTKPALAVGIVAIALCVTAGTVLITADRAGYDALKTAQAGDHANAVRQADRAARLVPIESSYRRLQIQTTYQAAVSNKDLQQLEHALELQRTFLRDFAGLPTDYLTLAQLLLALNQPGVDQALTAARSASPHGVDTAYSIEQISRQR